MHTSRKGNLDMNFGENSKINSKEKMTEFIVLYYTPKSAQDKCKDMSPDEMSKMMQVWMKWAENCGEHLVDMGVNT